MPPVAEGSSRSYSAYGVKVKENQDLYNQYLGAYRSVLSGVQSVGNAQRQAITDFYAHQQGQADQSLISRGLGNTTVQDSINRGLTLDQAKAQTDLSERVARMRADYESQMAQGIHAFEGGYSESQSQSMRPLGGGYGAGNGFSNGSVARSPFATGHVGLGGTPSYGSVWIGGAPGGMTGGLGSPTSVYVPGGDFAGEQGDTGQPFTPSGTAAPAGGYDSFGMPSGAPSGYDQSQYDAWA